MSETLKYQIARWVPAVFLWLTAASFLMAWLDYGGGWTQRAASLASLEVMALFAGGGSAFLLLSPAGHWKGRLVQGALAMVYLSLFLAFAYRDFGIGGLIDLSVMMGLTYAGVLFAGSTLERENARAEMVLRIVIGLILTMVARKFSGLPAEVEDWGVSRQALVFSIIYFGLLGVIEATGLYVLLRKQDMRTKVGSDGGNQVG